ncbi:YegS/Rv2252/BmrU family lipid kinase [Galbibacter sp. BG1]|uniref:diacylglycerol/lipid kinase family protein n=1 Tax=Galbibacter sp. BG1 TaxID=1170699 RepID=UPI0015BAA279|nr:YegS/Rv2252/BmrU family lipid kinase [Galbibacter sp. BG1]QLE00152.1 YegS/Rv2252/BmrU family lipid kinase [Galbibacter sp. BG1]
MEHPKQILLIVNPISGDKNKNKIIERIEKKAKSNDLEVSTYKTTGKNDLESIKEKIEKINPHRIIVVGGDGTIKLCVDALENKDIPLGVIPAGSANGMAVDLEIPLDIKKAVHTALNKDPKNIDVLNINGETAIHISDLGINAALVKKYDESSVRGKLGYALQSIPTLIDFKDPFRFKVKANDNLKEGSAMMIAIANARKYGNGAVINPLGKLNDGKFEILIFKTLQINKILQTVLNKIPLDDDFVEVISTDYAEIETTNPIPFQIDGEYIAETKNITIRMEKKQLAIVY